MTKVALRPIAEHLGAPILVTTPHDGSNLTYLVDQLGMIRIINADGTVLPDPFLDISARVNTLYSDRNDERGLLGLAFHPEFASNGRFFVFYTTPPRASFEAYDHSNILAEFRVSADNPLIADPNSERILLQFEQPFDSHAAGQLAFEAQTGYLLVLVGDALNAEEFPQDHNHYFGKILRLDVDKGDPYTIPADNPFVGQEGLPEIYALGLRHPWRLSGDNATNTIYFAEPAWRFHAQTIHAIQPAANYGWSVHAHPFTYDSATREPHVDSHTTPQGEPITPPLVEYGAEIGNIVSGVAFYSGEALPDLKGKLLFTDLGLQVEDGAKLLVASPAEEGNWHFEAIKIVNLPESVAFFWGVGIGADGEPYLFTLDEIGPQTRTGRVFKIIPVD